MLYVITILWITFALLGQYTLFLLLITIAFAESLRPHRNNIFLVNFLLATFFGGFPSLLLFISAQMEHPSERLCFAQSVMMDGVAPMFGIGLLALVSHTWTTLRAKFDGKPSIIEALPSLKLFMILAPYMAFLAWSMVSLAAGLEAPVRVELNDYVFCANKSPLGDRVREYVGYFMIGVGSVDLIFECRIIYRNLYCFSETAPLESHNLARHGLRILMLFIWQLAPILISALNSVFSVQSIHVKHATQLLESLNALAVVLIFGMQKASVNEVYPQFTNVSLITECFECVEVAQGESSGLDTPASQTG